MAVTAYASANVAPQANPSEPAIVTQASLPALPQLYGDAVDTLDGAPVWVWTWSIISTNYTGAPSITTPAAQNTTVTVDEWVNIRLFLVAENTNSGATSETDPSLAPDSAFVVIRVTSVNAVIERLSDGERNFIDNLDTWPTVIENLSIAPPAHTIASHSDTTATGAELETLTDGSNATGLHTHAGTDITQAAVGVYGVVKLEENGTGTATVITKERLLMTGSTFSSPTSGGINTDDIVDYGAASINTGHFWWHVDEDMELEAATIVMNDGGLAAPGAQYEFRVYAGTLAEFIAGAEVDISGLLTGVPANNNEPMEITVSGLTGGVTAGDLVKVVCTQAPTTKGFGLHATLRFVRFV